MRLRHRSFHCAVKKIILCFCVSVACAKNRQIDKLVTSGLQMPEACDIFHKQQRTGILTNFPHPKSS